MELKEAILTLKEYNKWRRGKGRKYSQPGVPFNPKTIGEAIDEAIKTLSANITDRQFAVLVYSCESSMKRTKTKAKAGGYDRNPEFIDYINDLADAVRAGKKSIRAMCKNQKK